MKILDKLEKPDLIVVDEWKERSEHYGQIRYDTFGHVELENNEIKSLEIEVEPIDLSNTIDTFLETSMIIHDALLLFTIEIQPYLVELHYYNDTQMLYIKYRWQEV